MNQKLLNFLVLCMLLTSVAFAQERKITGKVTSSDDNLGLPGVSVAIVGTNNMVQTDNAGNYSINVPSGTKALVFKSIGFETREINLSASNTVNVSLSSSNTDLNEVIVVAYGTVKKASNVGSSAQINAEQFDKKPISNALNALVGVAPGVQTTAASGSPGSSPGIRVRGFGSISASTSALTVVDGVVSDAGISNINPDDIESISVLKDAATTVLYGSRGANGVIMVTTKRGRKGQANLSVNVSNGVIERGLKEYERVDAYQYYPLMWEAYRNTLQYGAQKIPKDIASSIASGLTTSYNGNNYSGITSLLGYNPFNVANNQIVDVNGKLNPNASLLYGDDLDWASEIVKGGGKRRENYSMNYDAGTDKSDFFASFGYTNEEGYIAKSALKRFTGRVSANTQATKWLRTGLNISATQSEFLNDATGDGGSTIVNPFYSSRYIAPIYPVYLHDQNTGAYILDENGNRRFDDGAATPKTGTARQFVTGRHPIWENQLNNSKTERSAFAARTYATINFLPYLSATTNLSFDLQDSHDRDFTNPIIGDAAPAGRANHGFGRTRGYTWNQIVNFDKTFGDHTINALAGHENYQILTNSLTGSRSEIIVDGVYELPNYATVSSLSSSENIATVESYFSRVNYDFKQKYLLSASLRRDGNSKFYSDVRWANFWSVGAGYNIEREDFFNVKWVDLLKVRASYGSVGNAGGIGNYAYQALYGLGRNNAAEPGFSQSSLQNFDLTWETAKAFDLGVDFSLYKGRLSGSLEYYNKVTDGLIFAVPLAISNGSTSGTIGFSIDKNIGNLYNRGFELGLTGHIVKSKDFNYRVTLNATTLKNEITKMPEGQPLIQSGTKAYSVGHSIYDFYMREFYGVDAETGTSLYRTNTMTANAKIIGADTVTTILSEANYRYTGDSSIPDVFGSMQHNFSYKNFTLGVQLVYNIGGKTYDGNYQSLMHGGSYGTTLHVDALNRWQNPGDISTVSRFDNGNITNQTGTSDRYLISNTYLHINNITLNYNFGQNAVKAIGAKGASLYVSGDNIGLINKRQGMNNLGSFNGTVANGYNFSRVFVVGAKVRF
jgi:TonB-linked SusC/RagA family outer membrane protein